MDSLSYYGEDINNIRVSVEKKGSGMLRIKFEDSQNSRYEGNIKCKSILISFVIMVFNDNN